MRTTIPPFPVARSWYARNVWGMSGSGPLLDDESRHVAALRSADEARAKRAFATLIQAYYDGLLRYLTHRGLTRQAAEDVMQDVWLRIWASRTTLDVRETFRGYLYTAVRHQALDYVKAEQRHQRRVEAVAQALDSAALPGDASEALALDALETALRRAVGALPERCREVYILSREHGLSYPEIAATLGISVNTVKTQMGRAIGVLRRVAAPFLAAAVLIGR